MLPVINLSSESDDGSNSSVISIESPSQHEEVRGTIVFMFLTRNCSTYANRCYVMFDFAVTHSPSSFCLSGCG